MTLESQHHGLRRLPLDGHTELEREALNFINRFAWCAGVEELHEGIEVPDVIGVFQVKIRPARAGVDERLWIVVGDLPPAYLVADDNPTTEDAIAGYIREMRRWVEAVRVGQSVDELIPVNVPPTEEYAVMLAQRLQTLEEHFFPTPHALRGARKKKSR